MEEICVVCVREREREERRENTRKISESRILKAKMYINKENNKYKNIALQGTTTDPL